MGQTAKIRVALLIYDGTWEELMTTELTITAGAGGLDSRYFFPATLHLVTSFGVANGAEQFISYKLPTDTYRISFEGSGFGLNPGGDVHGIATSAMLSNSEDDVLGTMAVVPDADNPLGGAVINSAAWMTPDNLIEALSSYGGGHLNFEGGKSADKFFGSRYSDHFNGAGGRDRLTGGGGEDEFLFDSTGTANADHITDFKVGQDTIVLSHGGANPFTGVTANNLKSTFHDITKDAEQKDDRILYDHKTGELMYDSDGRGGHDAVVFAYIDNHALLDWRDLGLSQE
jgi:Ca2+-binding RTX toxin-like protein